ncbi:MULTISPECIES: hypothetical protein [Sphingobacterium]|uniref:hypothetical protein n=1 Tax=Sphingobacterium TaxID=28453 RepID=UPI00257979E9|nr:MULTISPECIES: hypothetical protein [Sphingobacterium]
MINKSVYMNFLIALRALGFIVVLIIVNACEQKNNKNLIVKAITVNNDMYGASDYSIEVFSDSTYRIIDYSMVIDTINLTLIDPKKNPRQLEREALHGPLKIKENVLFFDAACKNFNRAVLRNGYLDLYVDSNFVRRLLIEQASIPIPQYYNKSRFSDYAIFDGPKDSISDQTYEIKQNDLLFIDSALTSQLVRLKSSLGNQAYGKQLNVYANADSVWIIVYLFPDKDLDKDFYYRPTIYRSSISLRSAFEGAYGELGINLTKRSFSDLHFEPASN